MTVLSRIFFTSASIAIATITASSPAAANNDPNISKVCLPSAERQYLRQEQWIQPWVCEIKVNNTLSLSEPLWITDEMSFGPNSAASSIQSISSDDPWDCTNPPYADPGNTLYCGIAPLLLPYGYSILTVDVLISSPVNDYEYENCASVAVGELSQTGLPEPVATDCSGFPVSMNAAVEAEVGKVCADAIRDPDGIWTVQCEISISIEETQASFQIDIFDELTATGQQQPLLSSMPLSNGFSSYSNGTGFVSPGQHRNRVRTTSLAFTPANNNTLTLPYTATFSDSGGELLGNNTTNCVYAKFWAMPVDDIITERVCVPIRFPLKAINGPSIGSVAKPRLPAIKSEIPERRLKQNMPKELVTKKNSARKKQ